MFTDIRTPVSDQFPIRPVLLTVSINGETHIDNPQDTADALKIAFPFLPIPVRLERLDSGHDPDGGWLGCDWHVDLDPATTHLVAAGVEMRLEFHPPGKPYFTVEVPQP